eukprot:PITA_04397
MANKCCSCSRFFSCLSCFSRGNDPDAIPPVEGTSSSDALPPVEGTSCSDVPSVMEIPSVGSSSSAIEEGNVDDVNLDALLEDVSNLVEGTSSDALPPAEGTASSDVLPLVEGASSSHALPPVEGTSCSDVPAVMEIPSVGSSSSAIEEGNVDDVNLDALLEDVSNLVEGTSSDALPPAEGTASSDVLPLVEGASSSHALPPVEGTSCSDVPAVMEIPSVGSSSSAIEEGNVDDVNLDALLEDVSNLVEGTSSDALPPAEGTASSDVLPLVEGASSSHALPPVEGTSCSDVPAVMEIPSVGSSSSAIEEGNVDDVDLDALLEDVSNLLEQIKEGTKSSHKKTKTAQQYLPTTSKSFIKLKEFLSEAANFVKDIVPGDAIKTVASGILQGMGMAHLATAGLVVVVSILERFD